MAQAVAARKKDVADLARQILDALHSEHQNRLQAELDRVNRCIPTMHNLDTFERERLDALEGVISSLERPSECRSQAAAHLLEQLATAGTI